MPLCSVYAEGHYAMQNAIMLSVSMLKAIMQSVIVLIAVMPSVIMMNDIKLSHHDECH